MMNTDRNNEKLDELISRAIRREAPKFEFDQWKQSHKKEIQTYDSQTINGRISQSVQPLSLWRIIMKNRITQLTTAAAVICIAVVSLFFLDQSTTPAYGVTDLPGLFQQAKVIHIKGVRYFEPRTMLDGTDIPPAQIDNWIDLENGRSRYTGTSLSTNKDGVKVTISEMISDGPFKLRLNHTERNAKFFKTSDYLRKLDALKLSKVIHGHIFGDIKQLHHFEKTTSEQMNGVTYDIWQGETTSAIPGYANRLKFWLSPDTGKLGRAQMFSKRKGNQWNMNYDYYKIEYDVEIPQNVFSMEVPESYTFINTKETAYAIELGGGGGVGYSDTQYALTANTIIGFAMPNSSSIIVGWYSVDKSSEIPYGEYFTNLEFGGSLPKLPVEIYGFTPAVKSSTLTYTGYHLTYTQKENIFIEWSLYIPKGTPPPSISQLGYNALYRFNLDPEPKWRLGLSVNCRLAIENADDFNTWVLGAMAELSDDGKPPENITYERVMQLAQTVK